MGDPVPLGRACERCGEQVMLNVETEFAEYTDDLAGLLQTSPGEGVIVEAECGCPTPRRVTLEGAPFSPDAVINGD